MKNILQAALSLWQKSSVDIPAELKEKADEWLNNANTVIWFADEKNALAAVAIADKIKESSKEAISGLQQHGN